MERSETGYGQLHKARRTVLFTVEKRLGRAVPAAFFLLLWAFCVPGLSVRAAEAACFVISFEFIPAVETRELETAKGGAAHRHARARNLRKQILSFLLSKMKTMRNL